MKERENTRKMRLQITAEVEKRTETGLDAISGELLQKRIALIHQDADLQIKERQLSEREKHCRQLETFLAAGQAFFFYQFSPDGMQVLGIEQARKQGESSASTRLYADRLRLEAQQKEFQARESIVKMRERQYKDQIRPALEGELRAILERDIEARVSKATYDRGFAEGQIAGSSEAKTAGRVEVGQWAQEEHEAVFLDGYNACRQSFSAIERFRAGRIPANSPELEFLTNLGHPENPFNRGMQIGKRASMIEENSARLELTHKEEAVKDIQTETSQQNGAVRDVLEEVSQREEAEKDVSAKEAPEIEFR
jgi:hypothetical protein